LTGLGEATWTSPDIALPSGCKPEITWSHFAALYKLGNSMQIEVQRKGGSAWEMLVYAYGDDTGKYENQPRVIDLGKYAGDTIRYRYKVTVGADPKKSYLSPSLSIYTARLLNKKADQ